jgi:hypothetical protein
LRPISRILRILARVEELDERGSKSTTDHSPFSDFRKEKSAFR